MSRDPALIAAEFNRRRGRALAEVTALPLHGRRWAPACAASTK